MAPVQIKVAANDFLDFVNASPTPFHAVKSVKERLTSAGFKQINVSQLGHVAPRQAPRSRLY
jgi:aspartyl aminopeptidase